MVNTTLPLPILKYLELPPELVEAILLEYPFYQLPRVACILTHSQNLDNNGQDHNFFGFNKQKLNQYIHIFQQHSMEPILTEEDIDQPIEISSEPEVPFNDVDIIVSELEELSKEEKSRIINDQTIELDEDSSIEEHSIKEEIFMKSDLEAIDFDLTSVELESIHLQVESIEIDFENELILPDEELAEKLTRKVEVREINEDSDDLDIQDSFIEEANSISKVEDILELGILKASIETFDTDESILFETEAPIQNNILPAGIELLEREKLVNQAEQKEFIKSEVENELDEVKLSQVDNEKVEADVKDFNSWLAVFSTQPDSIENKSAIEAIDPTDEDSIELERNIQYSAQQSQMLASYEDEENEISKISRDDELEGVLKDTYFKSQVELKKAKRKTPSEMRIQDEAQLSLQPLNLISETMAILHAQQGNTSKSIEIYQKLIRLFPEKSSFFALQIQNLRK
jgi:hypothetical protein